MYHALPLSVAFGVSGLLLARPGNGRRFGRSSRTLEIDASIQSQASLHELGNNLSLRQGSGSIARDTLLSSTLDYFKQAAQLSSDGNVVQCVLTQQFIDGLTAYSVVLDNVGDQLGRYINSNVVKLQQSTVPKNEDYKAWLVGEHDYQIRGQTGWTIGYVDNSAWMGNLWIGRLVEFFSDFFSGLSSCSGNDSSKTIAENSYARTLKKHHSWAQAQAFYFGIRGLPSCNEVTKKLIGNGSTDDVRGELQSVSSLGGKLAQYCLSLDLELDKFLRHRHQVSSSVVCRQPTPTPTTTPTMPTAMPTATPTKDEEETQKLEGEGHAATLTAAAAAPAAETSAVTPFTNSPTAQAATGKPSAPEMLNQQTQAPKSTVTTTKSAALTCQLSSMVSLFLVMASSASLL